MNDDDDDDGDDDDDDEDEDDPSWLSQEWMPMALMESFSLK